MSTTVDVLEVTRTAYTSQSHEFTPGCLGKVHVAHNCYSVLCFFDLLVFAMCLVPNIAYFYGLHFGFLYPLVIKAVVAVIVL